MEVSVCSFLLFSCRLLKHVGAVWPSMTAHEGTTAMGCSPACTVNHCSFLPNPPNPHPNPTHPPGPHPQALQLLAKRPLAGDLSEISSAPPPQVHV